ncbi:MAG: FKBP-type peptidyl-prolyl cis-trans isomerase [Rhodoferax sp.]|uniref:FKBP-type peptidyl-prolyl cis-trans isomerase n=1 Tax=Rhodoferax sp. TaxID=50421 RepID=UPI00301990B0
MKSAWLLPLCLVSLQVFAQTAVNDPLAGANAANKELLQRGGKISPRQQLELNRAEKAQSNQQSAASFLATNKSRVGVVALASGVQYKILKVGAGKKIGNANSVRCFYQGMLVDGSRFDKAVDKVPAVMRVAGFVPGLQEAMRLMPAGSKWEIVIPPELGYGVQGNHAVAPNAVLIYEMEIVGIL